MQGCIKARGGWVPEACKAKLVGARSWARLMLLLVLLVHYETFQNHETVNSVHLPCPPSSFTPSLLWTEPHEEHWAVHVLGVGNRDLPPDSSSQLHITGEHAQPSPISATLEGQGEGPILRFYKLDAKFTQFYQGQGKAECKMAKMFIVINFASMSGTLLMCLGR